MTILLCEDERDLSNALKRILEISGYEVYQAYDGIQSLERAYERTYDVIILDVMMPRADGFQVIKTLREQGNNTPVIMLTARSEIDDKILGLDSGADDYMTKPFNSKELLARIKALIRRGGSFVEPTKFGNVILNANLSTIEARGSIHLTQTEFHIMEYLVKNSSCLCSTDDIMMAVWDYDNEVEINVVWTYISALRKKLDKIGADFTIIAHRGVGYKLGERK